MLFADGAECVGSLPSRMFAPPLESRRASGSDAEGRRRAAPHWTGVQLRSGFQTEPSLGELEPFRMVRLMLTIIEDRLHRLRCGVSAAAPLQV